VERQPGDGTVQVWDVDGKNPVTVYKQPDWVKEVRWSKDEKRILAWGADWVQVWVVGGKQPLTAYNPGERGQHNRCEIRGF
jgi:WD40 repeat protein